MLEMASSSRVTRALGSWEIRAWPYRFRLVRHSHGGTGCGSAHSPRFACLAPGSTMTPEDPVCEFWSERVVYFVWKDHGAEPCLGFA